MERIENALRSAVIQILSLPENTKKMVRFPYGSSVDTGDAPSFSRTSKVCFIYVLPAGEDYGRLSEITYRNDGGSKLTRVDAHTNVWQINFVCCGPTAYQWARGIRDGISREDVRERLRQSDLYPVPGSMSVTRVPEVKDGEWWNRYDLTAIFYEAVRQEQPENMEIIGAAQITPLSERSQ